MNLKLNNVYICLDFIILFYLKKEQKNIIKSLQKDLEASQQTCANLENLRIEMSMELENALKLSKKQELSLKKWKTFAMVMIPLTAITTIGIMSFAMNN